PSALALAKEGSRLMRWVKVKAWLSVVAPVVCVTLALAHFITSKSAVTTFSSLGPDKRYDQSLAWSISGSTVNKNRKLLGFRGQAEWFQPAQSGRLASIEMALQSAGPGGVNVIVARDNNGLPGEILERLENVFPRDFPPSVLI